MVWTHTVIIYSGGRALRGVCTCTETACKWICDACCKIGHHFHFPHETGQMTVLRSSSGNMIMGKKYKRGGKILNAFAFACKNCLTKVLLVPQLILHSFAVARKSFFPFAQKKKKISIRLHNICICSKNISVHSRNICICSKNVCFLSQNIHVY